MKKLLLFVMISALWGQFCTARVGLSVSLGPDQTVCHDAVFNFNPQISNGQSPFTFTWLSNGDTVSCDTCESPTSAITENSTFILVVTDANSDTATDTIHIILDIPGTITSSGPDTFCSGTPLILQTSSISSGYQWYLNGQPIQGATNNSYSVTDSSGIYLLIYGGEGQCQDTTNSIAVLIHPSPYAGVTPPGPFTFCQGDSVSFQTDSQLNVNYLWILDSRPEYDSSHIYTTTLAGSYQLAVTGQDGCVDSSGVIIVNVLPLPVVGFEPFSDDTVCNGGTTITLTGGIPAGGFYAGNAVTDDSVFNIASATVGLNVVTYSYTGPNECSNTAFENITVLNCTGIEEVKDADFISLYPNPAADYTTISVSPEAVGSILKIRDVTGREFLQTKITNEKFRLGTSNLAEGIYLVSVMLNDQTITRKLTVTRQN